MHHWWEVVTCHAKHVCFAILHLWELTSTENQKPLFSKFPVLVNCISCGNLLNAVIVVLTNYFLLWFIWNAWGRPIRQQCRQLPVGGWGMSSWPPVEAEWRYSTVALAFLRPGPASSGWTHKRWLPAGHSEWQGGSSYPKPPATKKHEKREVIFCWC